MNQLNSPRLPDAARQIITRINAAQRILLTSHIRLDGDALGSELGLFHILRGLGKRPHVVNDGDIPMIYRFLPGISEVGKTPDALTGDYDLAVILDVPSWDRAKAVRARLPDFLPVLSIDHHPPVERIGELDWVDTGRCSAGEMIYVMAEEAGWPVSPDAATCLYTAIVTDTGRFTFPNTTANALRAAAGLLECGADQVLVSEKVYQEVPPNQLALRGEIFQSLRLHDDGRIAVMHITREMLERHGVHPMDTQEMADYPRSVTGVMVGILLRELKDGKVKVSLRSREGVNIEPVARKFSGGGHQQAAGCEAAGSLDAVERTMVEECRVQVAKYDGN